MGALRVLLVEDDQHYRTYLTRALGQMGYDVRAAGTAGEGIDLGARFRCEVLIVNWMLGDEHDGLQVSRVIEVVHRRCQTILISGFSADTLQEEVESASVLRVLEKPFELTELVDAVRRVGQAPRTESLRRTVGLMEIDRAGEIISANDTARQLFSETRAGRNASNLTEIFGANSVPDLDAAAASWMAVRPDSKAPLTWQFRSQTPRRADGSRLAVFRRQREMSSGTIQLADILLDPSRLPRTGSRRAADAARLATSPPDSDHQGITTIG